MSTVIKIAGLSLVALLAGCTPTALLYSNTISPFSEEFNRTPVGTKSCVINAYEVKDPITGYNLSAQWSTSKILEKAHQAGISEIYYIDKRTLSILNGLYRRETLIVHGD